MSFLGQLAGRWAKDCFLCVGLDPDLERIPPGPANLGIREALRNFNTAIIDATRDVAAAYKPNIAFYERYGVPGMEALADTIAYIHDVASGTPVILDAKRGDNENTNAGYVTAVFDELGADAVTVHPYLGRASLQPFLDRTDKGVFVLCRTSNSSAPEFQDLETAHGKLYEVVAEHVARDWNGGGNCGLVVGATYPEELARVREIAADVPLLIPGVGSQGGDLEATVAVAWDSAGTGGFVINASRSILFASSGPDFADAAAREAQSLHRAIGSARSR